MMSHIALHEVGASGLYYLAWMGSIEDVHAHSRFSNETWTEMLMADRRANVRLSEKSAWYRGSVRGLARSRIQTAQDFGTMLDRESVY